MGVLTWADTYISAAHRPIDGGPLHGHTWRIRAYWPADGTDAVERQGTLHIVTRGLDHTELAAHLSRAEDMAAWLGQMIGGGPVRVDVWREAEGLGATWTL